jgi:hypothetical protein
VASNSARIPKVGPHHQLTSPDPTRWPHRRRPCLVVGRFQVDRVELAPGMGQQPGQVPLRQGRATVVHGQPGLVHHQPGGQRASCWQGPDRPPT